MKWTRQEEGMRVEVSLVPIEELPPAPEDLIKGLWILSKAENKNGDELKEYDPDDKQYILYRTDMRFERRNPDNSLSHGFWHMDRHKPILTLIDYDRSAANQEYTISFEANMLVMEAKSEDEAVYYYIRIHSFPE